ncbi:MAG: hypothetical protein IPN26_03015 [Bacteroidetes bacterium]|nr:hypothetical protein [Bacteroidota bacterium]
MANPAVNAGGVFEGFGTRASIGVFGRMSNVSLPYPGTIGAPNARYAIGGAFMSDDMTTNPWGPVANIGAYGHASNSLVMSAGCTLIPHLTRQVWVLTTAYIQTRR